MAEHAPPRPVSRRGFLAAGIAGASIAAFPRLASGGSVERLADYAASQPLAAVRPTWSHAAYNSFGVCSHPNFGHTAYRYTTQWMDALADTGAAYFRGMYSHGIDATRTATQRARALGIKWGMTVCPDLSLSDQVLVSRIRHIAANAADICRYIEGVNEPNYIRGSGGVPSDWVRRAVAKQKVIWDTVQSEPRLSHVNVLGPSLQAVEATETQYRLLGQAGLARYMSHAALHRYSGGRYPNHLIDERLRWVQQYWGGKPAWITEAGYTNALASRQGHRPVPEDVSAVYGPSVLLEAVDRGCKVSWFELLDDPDPGAKDDIESNFGMYAMTSGMAPPWRPKPVVSTMRSFLSGLKDPGQTYTPPTIGLNVVSSAGDVRGTVVTKRNGTATLYLRRATNCWDPNQQRRLTVQQVPVVVTTSRGARTVAVDHQVRAVSL